MGHHRISAPERNAVDAHGQRARTTIRFLRDNVLIAALYWSVSQLNMIFFSSYGVLPMPIWPAASIAVAVGLMLGWRGAPGLVIGTILANALALGSSWPVAAGISVMNTLGPLFGTRLIKRWATSYPPFGSIRDAGVFLVCGVVLIPMLTATGGIASILAGGRIGWDTAPLAWLRWWIAHASGTLLFAPLLLCWGVHHKPLPTRSGLEFLGASSAVLIVTALIFFLVDGTKVPIGGIAYVLIIPLIWVTVRFEMREAMTLFPLMMAIALAATVMGYGPFLGRRLPLVSVGVMVVVFGLTVLLLGALAATRRQAEEEHGRLASVVHHTADLINLATLDGRMVFLNRAGGAMLGIEPADAARHHILEVVAEDVMPVVRTGLLPALKEGRTWEGDLRYRNLKTGELTDVHAITFAIKDPIGGAPLYLANVSRDITERKRAEEERARLTTILETTNDVVALATPDGRLSYLNAAGRRMLGLGEGEDLAGYAIEDAHRPQAYDLIKNVAIPAALEKGIWQGETTLLSRDGREIPCSQIIMVHRSASGEVKYLSSIMRDISERKRAEEVLRRSEENYRGIFDASNEAMFVHDPSGAIVDVNQRMCRMFGVTREQAIGLQVNDFSSGESPYSQVEAVEWVKKAYEKGPQLFEWRCRRRNGELFWGEVALSRSRIGGADRVIAAVRDITERKRLEDQLRQAQKMEAVGQLAGGVAHDFNNLLQAINGYTDLALQEIEPAHAARPLLEEVLKAGDRAAKLVGQLLAFSRRQIIRPERLDVNEVVAGLLKMLVRVLGEHIRINFVPDHSPGIIHADRGQIEQVLMNLSVNARDAMPQGGTITIETSHTRFDDEYCGANTWAKPGSFVVLSVSDTGCGMDAQILPHIFDPFFTTKELGKGTGLGLATVYGIVKQHDGMITVYSEPGHGTVFKVYLPKVERSADPAEAETPEPSLHGTETVLLAEDDESVSHLSRRVLEAAGYTVLVAKDGEEALRIAAERGEQVALAVLDIVMPHLGGHAVHMRLKERFPRMRFLFASGYSADMVQTDFTLREGVELIQKPFDPKGLLRKVRQVLDRT